MMKRVLYISTPNKACQYKACITECLMLLLWTGSTMCHNLSKITKFGYIYQTKKSTINCARVFIHIIFVKKLKDK